jgi:hypothetical protein
MRWVIIAIVIALTFQSAHAEVLDAKILDDLVVEKTKAEMLVLQFKTEVAPTRSEYGIGRQKYTAAQQAFNNYTKAVLNNYKAGNRVDLRQSAQLAASQAKDFENYVSTQAPQGRGISAVFVAAGILLEIGAKLFTFVQSQQIDERARNADAIAPLVTWDEWDKIGRH